jgi:cellulose synthase/poly-beta-1,6-N-acetylglucosamine synthase-like glycosyltransferase
MMNEAAGAILFAIQVILLSCFSFYAFFNYLYSLAALLPARIKKTAHSNKPVAVVIVAYNEEFVLSDTLRACEKLTYLNRFIILADDSTDQTIAAKLREEALQRGCLPVPVPENVKQLVGLPGSNRVEVEILESPGFVYFHRASNLGFKGGILQQVHRYLENCGIELVYVLDADWHAQPDAIERCMEALEAKPDIAFVQTKRIAFESGIGLFQRYISLIEEACYYSDHEGRQKLGHPVLFSGCCALFRLDSVRDAGGFPAGHLTEDLDLSNRLWISGWKGVYLPEVTNWGEVPFSYHAFRRQQERWAAGTSRCLREYFIPILRSSHLKWHEKAAALRQNAYYFSSILVLFAVAVLCGTFAWLSIASGSYTSEYYLYLIQRWRQPLTAIIYACLLSNFMEPIAMILVKKRTWLDLLHLPMAVWYAWGTTPTYAAATIRGIFGKSLDWYRTPKYARDKKHPRDPLPALWRIVHVILAVVCLLLFGATASQSGWFDPYAYLWIPAFVLVSLP